MPDPTRLFFYDTLQDRAVQRAVFERELEACDDALSRPEFEIDVIQEAIGASIERISSLLRPRREMREARRLLRFIPEVLQCRRLRSSPPPP